MTMHIQLLSDLHNEFSLFVPETLDADVVIMAVEYEVAGTRVVCSPRGYPCEEAGFNPGLILTLSSRGRVA